MSALVKYSKLPVAVPCLFGFSNTGRGLKNALWIGKDHHAFYHIPSVHAISYQIITWRHMEVEKVREAILSCLSKKIDNLLH